jgi:hypothetical protein
MTTTAVPGSRTIASGPVRHHVRAVREWALGQGRGVCADSLTAIVSAADRPLGRPSVWRADDIASLVWIEVYTWCEQVEVPLPGHLPETLWTYLSWLAAHGLLAPGSDALVDLQATLATHTGLTRAGRPRVRPHRSRAGAPGRADAAGTRSGQARPGWGTLGNDPEPSAEVLPWRP